jgi:hypothetical protein
MWFLAANLHSARFCDKSFAASRFQLCISHSSERRQRVGALKFLDLIGKQQS